MARETHLSQTSQNSVPMKVDLSGPMDQVKSEEPMKLSVSLHPENGLGFTAVELSKSLLEIWKKKKNRNNFLLLREPIQVQFTFAGNYTICAMTFVGGGTSTGVAKRNPIDVYCPMIGVNLSFIRAANHYVPHELDNDRDYLIESPAALMPGGGYDQNERTERRVGNSEKA